MKKKADGNYAFIDGQNLYLGIKNSGWEIDFRKFRIYLRNKYNIQKAYYFIGYIETNKKLYSFLESAGFELIYKEVVLVGPNKDIKGNVDAELVLQAMIEYKNYDKAIIVSGDGDFKCLAEYLENNKKLLKIMTPNKQYSYILRKLSRYILPMGLLRNKLERKNNIK